MSTIEMLNTKFGIAGVVQVVAGLGGLAAVRVETGEAQGLVYLHGGHVAEWRPKGQDEVLWVSQKSYWADGKPVRGGVPVCFPWFGPKADDKAAPGHGFVRLMPWTLEAVTQEDEGVTVVLSTKSDDQTRKQWPGEYVLRHRVTIGRELVMSLELTNTGREAMAYQEALHTYFTVADVKRVKLTGLEGVKYVDKMDGSKVKTQEGAVTITAETDRVYVGTTGTVTIEDPDKMRRIVVAKEGSTNTVVWNPWVAKSKAMADFGDEEWPGMICVETCNVGADAVKVAAGETVKMVQRVGVVRM